MQRLVRRGYWCLSRRTGNHAWNKYDLRFQAQTCNGYRRERSQIRGMKRDEESNIKQEPKMELAGEYHCSDFEWEELKIEVEKEMSDKSSDNDFPGDAAVQIRLDKQGDRWERFHKMHNTAKFFKERRYILAEFPQLLSDDTKHVVEFGCGNGSAVIPLLKGNAGTRVTAIDFSETAVNHTRQAVISAGLDVSRCNFSVCDLSSSSDTRLSHMNADSVLMMFMLSAVPPNIMETTLRNAYQALRPGGFVFIRDYGMYDLTHLRFPKDQQLDEKLYHRGDGTLSYFFTTTELEEMFRNAGFDTIETSYVCVELYNRKKDFKMKRVFAHGVFQRSSESVY